MKSLKRSITNRLVSTIISLYIHEEFTVLNSGKYGFRKCGYDASGKSVDGKGELLFCLGLCNKTKEEMIEYIEQHIRED